MPKPSPISRTAALAAAERRRRLVEAHRAAARRTALEVAQGVDETTALDEARGAAFLKPPQGRGERVKPVRRLGGLEWLATRQPPRISPDAHRVGARWGALWRAATAGPTLRSSLDDRLTGRGSDPVLTALTQAEWRIHAAARLRALSAPLLGQRDLLRALTLVCGQDLTPREASRDGHDAARLEALLLVALDLLVAAETQPHAALPAPSREAN
jgi:hypothetical protein